MKQSNNETCNNCLIDSQNLSIHDNNTTPKANFHIVVTSLVIHQIWTYNSKQSYKSSKNKAHKVIQQRNHNSWFSRGKPQSFRNRIHTNPCLYSPTVSLSLRHTCHKLNHIDDAKRITKPSLNGKMRRREKGWAKKRKITNN